tara:strand:+ start:116 stop:487 length:372 start_codon:yes stop_codon:yes gene_type:complete
MNDMLEANTESKAVHQSYEQQTNNKTDSEISRKIISAIYSHYGKPSNIIEEKLTLYKDYSTPAGYKLPDWNEGGWQRGRLSIYVCENKITRISDSWFFHTDGYSIKIFINGQLDTQLEIAGTA